MPRHLFSILDDLTANLAELKAALAPLALIGGMAAEAGKPATAKRPAKPAAGGGRGPVSAKRREAMRVQGQYMGAIRLLSVAQRAEVKKVRAAKGAEAAIKVAHKLAR